MKTLSSLPFRPSRPVGQLCLCPLFLGAFLCGGGAAQKPSPKKPRTPVVFWEASLDEALARSKRIGRPVLIAVHRLGGGAGRGMLDSVYPEPDILSLLREFVCVAACGEQTPPIETGPRKGMSAVFLTVTSDEHRAALAAVRKRYLGDEKIVAPQHLFVNAAGHTIEQEQGVLSTVAFASLLTKVLDGAAPGWRPEVPDAEGVADDGSDDGGVPWAGLFDKDESVRRRAVNRLVRQRNKSMVLTMYRQLGDPAGRALILERVRASKKLDWAGQLIRVGLSDKEPIVRDQAAVTAEVAGMPDLLPDLLGCLQKEKNDASRCELLRAIGACAGGDKAAIKVLSAALKSREDKIRLNALVAMVSVAEAAEEQLPQMISVLVKRGLKDRNADTRDAAIWGLGQLRAKKAIPAVEKMRGKIRSGRGRGRRRGRSRMLLEGALLRMQGREAPLWDRAKAGVVKDRIPR